MENLLTTVTQFVSTTPLRWNELAANLPAELLTARPAPGEWSAVECLQHMIDTEQVFQARLQAFLAGRDFAAFNPDSEGTPVKNPSPALLAARFQELRAASLRALHGLSEADFTRTARHSELGLVTLEQMLHQWVSHDLNHTVQAERALMQPFLRGSGPWVKYFSDHLVKG